MLLLKEILPIIKKKRVNKALLLVENKERAFFRANLPGFMMLNNFQ